MCEICNSFGYVLSEVDGGPVHQIQFCHECEKFTDDVDAQAEFVMDLEKGNPHAWYLLDTLRRAINAPDYNTLFYKLHTAVKSCGSYDPEDCMREVEESLNQWEIETITAFLNWVVENNRTFGHNLPTVFGEWMSLKG